MWLDRVVCGAIADDATRAIDGARIRGAGRSIVTRTIFSVCLITLAVPSLAHDDLNWLRARLPHSRPTALRHRRSN
ncbi:MAG: hypothetical protein DMF97_21550 [Acidobacteria bacterium]|nr:MAG: hypothetical protein DMF97_21550 [Acidobacteriota bacterium]